jgi:hypothetical protein
MKRFLACVVVLLSTVLVAPSGCGSSVVSCKTHEDCGSEQVCVFSSGTCATACETAAATCPAGYACVPCATGSCPGCKDCQAACIEQSSQGGW